MLNEVFGVLRSCSVIISAQYVAFMVTNDILKHRLTKRDMSVKKKFSKKQEDDQEG